MYKKIWNITGKIIFLYYRPIVNSINLNQESNKKIYTFLKEEEINIIRKKHIKWKLISAQLRSFTPFFLIGNVLKKLEFIFIFSTIQIILGPNNINISSIIMNLFIYYYGEENSKYIFITYIIYMYLFLLHQYLSLKDTKITSIEKIGIFFSILMFFNYFYNQSSNIFIPIIFFIYSILIMPATLEVNNTLINEKLLEKDYSFYAIL